MVIALINFGTYPTLGMYLGDSVDLQRYLPRVQPIEWTELHPELCISAPNCSYVVVT